MTEPGGRSLNYDYDAVGNVIRKNDYQGHDTRYQYDSTNRLVGQRNAHFLQVSYHYDAGGRLLNRTLSNGTQTDYRYDSDNRLIGLKNKHTTQAPLEDLGYQRDQVGNVTQITDGVSGRALAYTYDPLLIYP